MYTITTGYGDTRCGDRVAPSPYRNASSIAAPGMHAYSVPAFTVNGPSRDVAAAEQQYESLQIEVSVDDLS